MRESALNHAVSGYFTQITGAQFPQLGCDGIFLHQGLLEADVAACDELSYLRSR